MYVCMYVRTYVRTYVISSLGVLQQVCTSNNRLAKVGFQGIYYVALHLLQEHGKGLISVYIRTFICTYVHMNVCLYDVCILETGDVCCKIEYMHMYIRMYGHVYVHVFLLWIKLHLNCR